MCNLYRGQSRFEHSAVGDKDAGVGDTHAHVDVRAGEERDRRVDGHGDEALVLA